ncbi:cAMP-dependent protein kinase type II regulatory subunit [Nymphon striatum]|nr:cAMP-dependent protein kinase type II regulatory subunit [Nymphon striatum]
MLMIIENLILKMFAEQYNPEEEDGTDEREEVHPKSDEQRKRLTEAVKNTLLFRSLDDEQMRQVLDAMFERKVTNGEYVIKQGDNGDNFYVIDNGAYNVYVGQDDTEKKLIGQYDNSGSFGELALLYNMPRAATIEATSTGTLWAMSRQTFRRILLKNAFKKRKMYESLLNCVPMLKALEEYERMNLADALISKTYGDETLIIKQGDDADGMYFVEAGTVKITVFNENDGKEIEVSRLSEGQYFGELALVTHKPRAASAYAIGNLRLAFLDVDAFERLLGPCMDIMKRCIDDYEEQLIKIFGSKANISDIR